ncbi:MAG TPA: hypothetical protein VFX59_23275 [Polyangiales bacterium]|nr:hypothetical protein [Polyangiales bacterium]
MLDVEATHYGARRCVVVLGARDDAVHAEPSEREVDQGAHGFERIAVPLMRGQHAWMRKVDAETALRSAQTRKTLCTARK